MSASAPPTSDSGPAAEALANVGFVENQFIVELCESFSVNGLVQRLDPFAPGITTGFKQWNVGEISRTDALVSGAG
jgi:hypothetical protein